jgi:hypothetical protein
MTFVHNDGGRAAAGFRGDAGDCVTRAIAIAAEMDYREVYDALFQRALARWDGILTGGELTRRSSPRDGCEPSIYRRYLDRLGWTWTPTMHVGQGCTVHLRPDELPSGRLICRLSKHLVAVIDGVPHDTHDPSREGTRCVYGYWSPPSP